MRPLTQTFTHSVPAPVADEAASVVPPSVPAAPPRVLPLGCLSLHVLSPHVSSMAPCIPGAMPEPVFPLGRARGHGDVMARCHVTQRLGHRTGHELLRRVQPPMQGRDTPESLTRPWGPAADAARRAAPGRPRLEWLGEQEPLAERASERDEPLALRRGLDPLRYHREIEMLGQVQGRATLRASDSFRQL